MLGRPEGLSSLLRSPIGACTEMCYQIFAERVFSQGFGDQRARDQCLEGVRQMDLRYDTTRFENFASRVLRASLATRLSMRRTRAKLFYVRIAPLPSSWKEARSRQGIGFPDKHSCVSVYSCRLPITHLQLVWFGDIRELGFEAGCDSTIHDS